MKQLALSAGLLTLVAFSAPAQSFDIGALDKYAAKAKESVNITLDENTLKLSSGLFSGDTEKDVKMKRLVSGLKSVVVRSFEFDKPGQYVLSDLDPIRAQLNNPRWSKIVSVQEKDESVEVFLQPIGNDQIGGLVVLAAEPNELTVVSLTGVIRMQDVSAMGGNFGVPEMFAGFLAAGPKSGAAVKNQDKGGAQK